MPLENLLGPVGDLYCFSNTFRMLVSMYVHLQCFMHVFACCLSGTEHSHDLSKPAVMEEW